ncbi:MAG: ester cyclase [Williamsia sp.]|nr:ester cyclase [Williamsia sp.]
MLSTENNKIIASLFLQLVSRHNVDELCKMVSPGWRMHGGPPNLSEGPEGVRELFSTFGSIEQQWVVEDMIAEGDKVVIRATNTCRQDSFFGVPAQAVQQTFTAIFIHKIVNGRIAETWRNANDLGRLLQLGAKISP